MQLPTYAEMEKNALHYLDRARNQLSEVRDELNSDWRPDAPPTDSQHDARERAMRLVADAKALIDQAKQELES